jgi:hypothetical protein
MLPNLRKNMVFWKVPSLCPSVLVVRETCRLRWNWVWSNGGIILTGEKPVPVPRFPPQFSQVLSWDRSLASEVTRREAGVWLPQPWHDRLWRLQYSTLCIKIQFVLQREHSVLPKTSRWLSHIETTLDYFTNCTTRINSVQAKLRDFSVKTRRYI